MALSFIYKKEKKEKKEYISWANQDLQSELSACFKLQLKDFKMSNAILELAQELRSSDLALMLLALHELGDNANSTTLSQTMPWISKRNIQRHCKALRELGHLDEFRVLNPAPMQPRSSEETLTRLSVLEREVRRLKGRVDYKESLRMPSRASKVPSQSKAKVDKYPDEFVQKVAEAWNETMGLGRVRVLSNDRRTRFRRACEALEKSGLESEDVKFWESVFQQVAKSPFLTGKVKDFRATFDWISKEANVDKVLSGAYSSKKSADIYNGSTTLEQMQADSEKYGFTVIG